MVQTLTARAWAFVGANTLNLRGWGMSKFFGQTSHQGQFFLVDIATFKFCGVGFSNFGPRASLKVYFRISELIKLIKIIK